MSYKVELKTPPHKHFKVIVSQKGLKNCPVEVNDINNAQHIFGSPSVAELKGRSTRQLPGRVDEHRVKVPREYYKLNKFVTLTADVMFVAGVPFLLRAQGGSNLQLVNLFLDARQDN